MDSAEIIKIRTRLYDVSCKNTVSQCPHLNHLSSAWMYRSSRVMPPITLTFYGCFIDEKSSIRGKCTSRSTFRLLMFRIASEDFNSHQINSQRLETITEIFSPILPWPNFTVTLPFDVKVCCAMEVVHLITTLNNCEASNDISYDVRDGGNPDTQPSLLGTSRRNINCWAC